MEIVIRNSQRLIKIKHTKVKRILRKALRYLKEKNRLDPLLVACYSSMELSVLFINDRRMRELNLLYRGKDKTTDVLSFPQLCYSVRRKALSVKPYNAINAQHITQLGDIVVNIHQAKRQAEEHGVTFYEEIARLLIHGLLHLLGYDHEKNKYQARKMREMERELLSALPLDPVNKTPYLV